MCMFIYSTMRLATCMIGTVSQRLDFQTHFIVAEFAKIFLIKLSRAENYLLCVKIIKNWLIF